MKRISFVIALLLFAFMNAAQAQTVEKSVEKIRSYYNEVSKKVEFIEQGGEQGNYGELICNELSINKYEHSWPAVGIYRVNFKFFYEFDKGDANRDPNPYPDKIVKIVSQSDVSSRHYYQEFLYDKTGALIFYFLKAEEDETPKETRVYFSAGKAIRLMEDEKKRDKLTADDLKTVREILKRSAQVKEIFTKSLSLPSVSVHREKTDYTPAAHKANS